MEKGSIGFFVVIVVAFCGFTLAAENVPSSSNSDLAPYTEGYQLRKLSSAYLLNGLADIFCTIGSSIAKGKMTRRERVGANLGILGSLLKLAATSSEQHEEEANRVSKAKSPIRREKAIDDSIQGYQEVIELVMEMIESYEVGADCQMLDDFPLIKGIAELSTKKEQQKEIIHILSSSDKAKVNSFLKEVSLGFQHSLRMCVNNEDESSSSKKSVIYRSIAGEKSSFADQCAALLRLNLIKKG